MGLELRYHQTASLDAAKYEREHNNILRPVIKLPTGVGKTPVLAKFADYLGLKGRVLALAHTEELIDQGADNFRNWNPGRTVGIEQADRYAGNADIVMGSVKTLGLTGSNRLSTFPAKDFGCVLIDECFPAGTLVDRRPIEQIAVGDYVTAYNSNTHSVSKKRVVRLFKNPVGKMLLRITTGNKSVVCTPGHPFFTKEGWWTPALELSTKEQVLLHELRPLRCNYTITDQETIPVMGEGEKSILRRAMYESLCRFEKLYPHGGNEPQVCLGEDEDQQSDEQARCEREGNQFVEEDWAQAYDERRQRTWPDTTRASSTHTSQRGLANADSYTYQDSQGERVPDLLQSGPFTTGPQASGGGRWGFPLSAGQAGAGPQKSGSLEFAGVDSVEILEQGSDGRFEEVCGDGFVYNIEVEDDHTYVANGFVVHNCHHSTATTYQNILNGLDVVKNGIMVLGVTATTKRGDGFGLAAAGFQKIVYDLPLVKAIREGWLVNIRCVKVTTGKSLDDIHTKNGDFDIAELNQAFNTAEMNELVVKSWLEHGQDRQTVAFGISIEHCKDLAATFKKYGVSAEAIWGTDPDRATKLALHKQRHIRILINCQLLTEGYDDWQIGCILLDRATKSELLFQQMVGRGTRLPYGIANLLHAKTAGIAVEKEDLILIDMVHATSKHSLATLASLVGLNPQTDLRGKKITDVLDEVEAIQLAKPAVDVTEVTDINKLKSYAEEVDLFKVTFPPEILSLSKFQWRKVGGNGYVLLLQGRDAVTIISDILDRWHIVGKVNGAELQFVQPTLEDAIKEADNKVIALGGSGIKTLINREAKWHKDPPTSAQLFLCRKMRIHVPTGATKGQVHLKINEVMASKRKAA